MRASRRASAMARAAPRPSGSGLRGGVGVEAAAQAEHLGVNRGAALLGPFQLLEHQHAGPFAEHEAVAPAVEGPRHLRTRADPTRLRAPRAV